MTMKYPYLFVTFWLLTSTAFAHQSDQLELLDIFNLEYVSDPQISPDGNQVIYSRNFKDVMTDKNHSNLWLIDFNGNKEANFKNGIATVYDINESKFCINLKGAKVKCPK